MTIDHRSPAYDPEKERAWYLALWVAPEHQAWSVHDRSTGALLELHAHKGEHPPSEERLPRRPHSVSFTVLPEISTLVPESVLVPGQEMRHLRMVHGNLPTGLLRDEPVGVLGARCVYLHDEGAEHRLLSRYPNARSLPLQVILLQAALARSGQGTTLVLHRSEKRLDLALAQDKRLLLSNTFHAVTPEDVLYHALFALQQCGIATDAPRVLVCGTHITLAEEELLARYLKQVSNWPVPVIQERGVAFLERPHRWAALMEQFACAS